MSEPYIDCAIIGGGLFGSIIAKKLRAVGMNVFVIDNKEKMAGSNAAACLMKPSWYSSMGRDSWEPAMQELSELYNIQEISFSLKITKTKAFWINPISILCPPDLITSVKEVKFSNGHWEIHRERGPHPVIMAKNLILAAGVWCNKLLSNSGLSLVTNLSNRTGTSFKKFGTTEPEIIPYAPYRQMVKFNISPQHIWVGDGTANKHYEDLHFLKSRERCAKFIESPVEDLSFITGHRPYVKDAKPCYLEKHAAGLWVITGGAKNGTIAAGWAAHRMGEILT